MDENIGPQRINDKNNNGNNNNEDDKDDRIMVTISIVGLYAAGTVAGRAKVEGLFSRGKMPVLGKETGETGWREEMGWESAREKLEEGRERWRRGSKGLREKGSWFKRKQGTGNTEKVKEIYEVGEQNGRRTWARY